jgi:hypothetical protein
MKVRLLDPAAARAYQRLRLQVGVTFYGEERQVLRLDPRT